MVRPVNEVGLDEEVWKEKYKEATRVFRDSMSMDFVFHYLPNLYVRLAGMGKPIGCKRVLINFNHTNSNQSKA